MYDSLWKASKHLSSDADLPQARNTGYLSDAHFTFAITVEGQDVRLLKDNEDRLLNPCGEFRRWIGDDAHLPIKLFN